MGVARVRPLLPLVKMMSTSLDSRMMAGQQEGDGGLESEEQQEGHHKTEETHSLREGKAQDGVREQLLLQ